MDTSEVTGSIEAKPYIPTEKQAEASALMARTYIKARNVVQRTYPQFNGRTLYDCIDDWTKRWNGYVPAASVLLESWQSRVFLNFTRTAIISYLSKTSLTRPKIKIEAVNKKNGLSSYKLAEALQDMNEYSLQEPHGDVDGDKRFLEAALEVTTKGTCIKYEGYAKNTVKTQIPIKFDAETGSISYKTEERVLIDNCYQQIVNVEDFYILNPYEPDVQKQPACIWRQITTYDEAAAEFSHYKDWDCVPPGAYTLTSDPTTFYRNRLMIELAEDQVEVLRGYWKAKNKHIIQVNGVVIYYGPIPFRDGNYPFAKGIFEPYGNDFFWGMGFPEKIMGEQDLINTTWNMMVDKTYGSLLPMVLSSEQNSLIDDDVLAPNKIRQVQDINKWRFENLPGVTSSEQAMLQTVIGFFREHAPSGDAAQAMTPRGGKLQVRQVLLQQQEAMSKLGFSVDFMEDYERDRTQLRVNHILQFWTIPKIEKVTGKRGKEIEQLLYREVQLPNSTLEDGKKGTKVIKLIGGYDDDDEKQKIEDELSLTEAMGDESGVPTEALAVNVETLRDYNYSVYIVRRSEVEKNQVLDQAIRKEYAQWRMSMMQFAPVNVPELVAWVSESYDLDPERFEMQGQPGQQGMQPGMQPAMAGGPPSAAQQMPDLSGMMDEGM